MPNREKQEQQFSNYKNHGSVISRGQKLLQKYYKYLKYPNSEKIANKIIHILKFSFTFQLPAFPSWALTHIGASTIYSHSSGVNQSGFLSGCRNLHAWDFPLKKINFKALQVKFPNLAENAMKRANFHPAKKGLEMGITAKIFIGMEYECPRGHRFISGTVDKAVRTTKEIGTGSRFVNNDIPLYLTCPCRGGKFNFEFSRLISNLL